MILTKKKKPNVTFINKTNIFFLNWDDFLPWGTGGVGSQNAPITGVQIKWLLILD